jgi:glutamate racemase
MAKIIIGVFDSGVGGMSVVSAINKSFDDVETIYVEDKKNVPYGNKTNKQLYTLAYPILSELSKKCDIIVIACNTVTTNIIEELRSKINIPIIGMEPMIKPASLLTKTKKIAVCATVKTLSSKRYKYLKDTYAKGVEVIEPDCSDWASMIESNTLNLNKINDQIEEVCRQGVDVIVLGCTHYHWIEDIIDRASGDSAKVLQPENSMVEHLKIVINDLLKARN